jgi:hypothetical protein
MAVQLETTMIFPFVAIVILSYILDIFIPPVGKAIAGIMLAIRLAFFYKAFLYLLMTGVAIAVIAVFLLLITSEDDTEIRHLILALSIIFPAGAFLIKLCFQFIEYANMPITTTLGK